MDENGGPPVHNCAHGYFKKVHSGRNWFYSSFVKHVRVVKNRYNYDLPEEEQLYSHTMGSVQLCFSPLFHSRIRGANVYSPDQFSSHKIIPSLTFPIRTFPLSNWREISVFSFLYPKLIFRNTARDFQFWLADTNVTCSNFHIFLLQFFVF